MKKLIIAVTATLLLFFNLSAETGNVYLGNLGSTFYQWTHPIDWLFQHSLTQTIYLETDINLAGYITQLTWRLSTVNIIPEGIDVKIYLSTTQISHYATANAYIPLEGDYALVYNAPLSVSMLGAFNVTAILDTPFLYNGGNLLVTVVKSGVSEYSTQNAWQVTSVTGRNSAIRYYRNDAPFDEFNPGMGTALSASIPNLTLTFDLSNLGTLTGTVTTGTPPVPVSDVRISLDGTLRHVTSLSNGVYTMPYIQPGIYSITATKEMYFEEELQNIEILPNQTTTQHITMQQRINDLATISFLGSLRPIAGEANIYSVTVRNIADNLVAGASYDVKLYQETETGDIQLAVLPGQTINSLENIVFEFAWIPSEIGDMKIYGFVDFSIDNNISNNRTETMSVQVQPSGYIVTYLGDPNSTAFTNGHPFNFLAENSLSQTIYRGNEINAGGYLKSITYKFRSAADITAPSPIAIYVANVPEDFEVFTTENGWLPFQQFTEVFNGFIEANLPDGEHEITLTLENPFIYDGRNLIVNTLRKREQKWSVFNLFHQTLYPNEFRTLGLVSDAYNINHIRPAPGTLRALSPNTLFIFDTNGLGHMTGTIQDEELNIPISEAEVKLTDSNRSIFSNLQGVYNFNYAPIGVSNFTISKHGYFDNSFDAVILEFETIVQNITLTPIPTTTVTGRVVGSDNLSPLANAIVTLTGYDNYEYLTDETGVFIFTGVYQSFTYQLKILREGYFSHTNSSIFVGSEPLDLGDIILPEQAWPPHNVNAQIVGNNAVITWDAPLGGQNVWFSHSQGDEFGDAFGGWGTDFEAIVVHRFTPQQLASFGVAGAELTHISLYLRTASPIYELRIYIGGTASPALSPGTLVHSQPISDFDVFDWNQFELTTSITIPTNEEMWIGYYVLSPPLVMAAPTTDLDNGFVGFGDVFFTEGIWTTMLAATNGSISDNWMIRAMAKDAAGPIVFGFNNDQYEDPIMSLYNRSFEGYNVYRALLDVNNNLPDASEWTTLITNTNATVYTDANWGGLSKGAYRYVVRAIYTNDNLSAPKTSNMLAIDMLTNVTININTPDNSSATGALVKLTNNSGDLAYVYEGISDNNTVVFPQIWNGMYTLSVSLIGYENYINPNLLIQDNPFVYTASLSTSNIWINEGFENNLFPPYQWSLINNDSDNWNWIRWDLNNYLIWGSGNSLGFLSNSGNAATASHSYVNPNANNGQSLVLSPDNFLVMPKITTLINSQITLEFYSWTMLTGYPIETLSVMVAVVDEVETQPMISVSGRKIVQFESIPPEYFTHIVHTQTFSSANTAPTLKTVSLNSFAGETIYIAFRHHNSTNNFGIAIDDVRLIVTDGTSAHIPDLPPIETALYANYPNPFNPSTTIHFDIANETNVKIDIYNIRGQLVTTLIDTPYKPGRYKIDWNGDDNNGRIVASGVYFFQMHTNDFSDIRRMVLMK